MSAKDDNECVDQNPVDKRNSDNDKAKPDSNADHHDNLDVNSFEIELNKEKDMTIVVAEHYNQLEEKGLDSRSQSRILHLRNFNNWIKSMLIRDYLQKVCEKKSRHSIKVLDIGAGKGGDLLKWKKGDIGYLVCADIAGTSLEQCNQRYEDLCRRQGRSRDFTCFKADFITADCTKTRLKDVYKDPSIQFDLVSCQFSFHYCFESYSQAQKMIQNASECLLPGGYFIGTTPDSYDIVRRLHESPGLKFGNDVFSVTFNEKENIPLFGAKYDFHLEGVVNCPEFLVYFPAFEELAAQNGLKLVYKKRFEDFFDEHKDDFEGKQLLNRMKALETYPGNEKFKLAGPEDDYHSAKIEIEKLKQSDSNGEPQCHNNVSVGTMSKSEWEAVCMYLVFAFMKVKL